MGYEWNYVTCILSPGPTLDNSVLRLIYNVFSCDWSHLIKNYVQLKRNLTF